MDLDLVAGDFMYDDCIPKDKRWLSKYFKLYSQKRFLAYYFLFYSLMKPHFFYRNFRDHTGIWWSNEILLRYIKRLKKLEKVAAEAFKEMDFKVLSDAKSGQLMVASNGKSAIRSPDGTAL